MKENSRRDKFADELIAALLDIIIKNKIILADKIKLKLRMWVMLYDGEIDKTTEEQCLRMN